MNRLVSEYEIMFNETPRVIIGIDYEDEEYQKLLEQAILRGTPITDQEYETLINNVPLGAEL